MPSPESELYLLSMILTALTAPLLTGCGRDAGAGSTAWAGTIDTLPSGQVVVTNSKRAPSGDGEGWIVTEDLRIGALDEPGPYELGQVIALDVDALGRIWVLEGQSKEVRVFDAAGRHVRTVGRAGGGPGEFNGPADAEFGPDGRLWVADPQNNRVSVIDTSGVFATSYRMEGGFYMSPWPGGFDLDGNYYLPVPSMDPDRGFGIVLVRHGPGLVPVDTIPELSDPVERERFELTSADGRLIASVPFSAGFRTHRSPLGTMWGLFTADYRFFEVDRGGDTLRTVEMPYDPLPVTRADREAARESLSWFTDQGGKIDLSRIPNEKPAAHDLFVDEQRRLWVARVSDRPQGQDYDVFDREGRFLGPVTLPAPFPTIRRVRGDYMYGVTHDELGVPYIVRARLATG